MSIFGERGYIIRNNVLDQDCYFAFQQSSYLHVSKNPKFVIYQYIVSLKSNELVLPLTLPPKVELGLLEARLESELVIAQQEGLRELGRSRRLAVSDIVAD